jgi:hypothetical protein
VIRACLREFPQIAVLLAVMATSWFVWNTLISVDETFHTLTDTRTTEERQATVVNTAPIRDEWTPLANCQHCNHEYQDQYLSTNQRQVMIKIVRWYEGEPFVGYGLAVKTDDGSGTATWNVAVHGQLSPVVLDQIDSRLTEVVERVEFGTTMVRRR